MPLYEYLCKKCTNKFEARTNFANKDNMCCPKCQSKAQRIFTPPALHIISDAELTNRLLGVPKERLERTREMKEKREKERKEHGDYD